MTKKSFLGWCAREGYFRKAWRALKGSKGLYVFGHKGVLLKRRIIRELEHFWEQKYPVILTDAPILVPSEVLRRSGHLDRLSQKMFRTQDDLYLRPEISQGIYNHLKWILFSAKKKPPVVVLSNGKIFRKISARKVLGRARETEQFEAYLLTENDIEVKPLIEELKVFMENRLGIQGIEIIQAKKKPFYSNETYQFRAKFFEGYVKFVWISDRTGHSFECHNQRIPWQVKVWEFSFFVDRILLLYLYSRACRGWGLDLQSSIGDSERE